MARRNKGRLKKWIQFNKAGVIWIAVVMIYTLIMLAIILGSGFDFKRCTTGSLTDTSKADNVNIETSVKPES